MDRITIKDMAVKWRVGVTAGERSKRQKLLLTIEMDADTAAASRDDDLKGTVDYYAVSERLRHWGNAREWKLIETLAAEAAELVLTEFKPAAVAVEVKKFVLSRTAYVSVKTQRTRPRTSRKAILP